MYVISKLKNNTSSYSHKILSQQRKILFHNHLACNLECSCRKCCRTCSITGLVSNWTFGKALSKAFSDFSSLHKVSWAHRIAGSISVRQCLFWYRKYFSKKLITMWFAIWPLARGSHSSVHVNSRKVTP